MRLNGGLGAVTVKNVPLQSFAMVDCLNAVKHGNGRDWWLIFRENDYPGSNNEWCSYLITPAGIQNFSIQTIGEQNRTGGGHTTFSSNGNKLVFTNWADLVELYDFDRCTGLLSNPITIENDPGMSPYLYTWGCEFSTDGSKLYVSTNTDTSHVFQYDLNAPNISASKDTIWTIDTLTSVIGALKLGPDNKIYLCNQYFNGFNTAYPYPDSVYNVVNMNLSVINHPDSLGVACDFQPFSFYLGGKRAYKGLPNNPDYEMGPLVGSVCDTLVGLPVIEGKLDLVIFPNPAKGKIFFDRILAPTNVIKLFDASGRLIVTGTSSYELDINGVEDGFYVLKVFENQTDVFIKNVVIIN